MSPAPQPSSQAPKRWLIEETFPSGTTRWSVVEHENHARRLGETLQATVTPLYDHPSPSPRALGNEQERR
jgi:hypothetical protein